MNTKTIEMLRSEANADYMAEEARERNTMTGGRNLYKLWAGDAVAAFISTYNRDRVMGRYLANGGKKEITEVEKISFGYPHDMCKVYA